MKFGAVVALAVATIAVLAETVKAQDLSKCVSFSFKCGSELYQAGEDLALSAIDGKDSCKMGNGWYRPMNQTHWEDLKSRVLALDLATIDDTAKKLKCRGYQHRSKGWGPSMSSFTCYMEDGTNYMWKKPGRKTPAEKRNIMPACDKTVQYFSTHDPYLGRGQGCDPADDAEFQCQPGLICAATVEGKKFKCVVDPMRDHECCLSNNEMGCEPGTCCAGSYCRKGKCRPGWEPKSVTELKGICDDMTKIHPRKTGILEGNLCLKTPDIVFNVKRTNKKTQGDCALGLHCRGRKGYGFCKWWKKYQDKCAMKVWKRGCIDHNDCQEGTYCKHKARYSQCVPRPYGWEAPEGEVITHDGLCTGIPLAERKKRAATIQKQKSVFSKKLGKCTGAIGSSWGDPHIISFDKAKWNCQAQGDFVITNNTLIEVHARYDGMKNKGYKISQAKAFSVKTGQHTPNDRSDDGMFQIWFPENYVDMTKEQMATFDNHKVFQRGYKNDCPVAMQYTSWDAEGNKAVENVKLDLENGVVKLNQNFLETHSAVTAKVTKISGKGVYLVLDWATGATTQFRIHGGGSSAWNGCVMSVDVCLPGETTPPVAEPYTNITGLLGTPNGHSKDDWMDHTNTFVEMIMSGKDKTAKQFEYCTKNWCIREKTDMMLYQEDQVSNPQPDEDLHLLPSQYYIKQCDSPWPGDMDVNECKQFEKIDIFLKGETFEYFMTEKNGDFPQAYLDACLECHMGPDNCVTEVSELKTLSTEPDAGVDGNPDPILDPVVNTCDNLGTDLSQTTGPTRFELIPPPPKCSDEDVCTGYDDSYGLFVGGKLTIKMAEDIEGRLYVGGGLTIENPTIPEPEDEEDPDAEPSIATGEDIQLNGIGWATCGSHLCPSSMARIVEVCGNLEISMPEDEQVKIMPLEEEVGLIAFTGLYKENEVVVTLNDETASLLFATNGEVKKVDAAEVCPIKDDRLTPLKSKSAYWATEEYKEFALGVYGEVQIIEETGLIVLKKPQYENGCPVIFNIDAAVFDTVLADDVFWTILFDQSLGTNTVLINVLGEQVNFSKMLKMQEEVSCLEDGKIDCTPSEGYAFSTELVTNLLWNFPQAKTIQFGESFDIAPFTWEGSILAPHADVTWHYSSHRGRMVVGANMVLQRHDAVFLNYPFSPEACALQDPTQQCIEVAPLASDVCAVEDYITEANGNTKCPLTKQSIVNLQGVVGAEAETSPADGLGIIYGIQFSEDKATVTFNVNNPYGDEADIYLKHSVQASQDSSWLESRCDASLAQDHCLRDNNLDTVDRQFEVACEKGKADAYIYFVTRDTTIQGGATVDKCCYAPEYGTDVRVVEYSYQIMCDCPSDDSTQTGLRH